MTGDEALALPQQQPASQWAAMHRARLAEQHPCCDFFDPRAVTRAERPALIETLAAPEIRRAQHKSKHRFRTNIKSGWPPKGSNAVVELLVSNYCMERSAKKREGILRALLINGATIAVETRTWSSSAGASGGFAEAFVNTVARRQVNRSMRKALNVPR